RRADEPLRRRGPARSLLVGARLARARPPGQDPLPRRLRRPLPGLRRGSEPRAALARRGGAGSALGGAFRAPGQAVVAAILAGAHGGPQEEDVEGAPRQAPRAAPDRG